MNQDNFRDLLEDLYNIYNPSGLKDVDFLIEKYNGREFDAIKYFYLRYNSRFNDNYDPEAGSNHKIKYLINKYSNGERVLSKESLKAEEESQEKALEEQQKKAREEEERKTEELQQEIKNNLHKEGQELTAEIKKAVNEKVEEYFQTKKQDLDVQLDNLFKTKSQEIQTFFIQKTKEIQEKIESINDIAPEQQIQYVEQLQEDVSGYNMEVRFLNLNFESVDADLDMPNKDIMEMVSIGERLVLKDSEGNITGIEIKDITYDFVSYEDRCIKEIALEKLN